MRKVKLVLVLALLAITCHGVPGFAQDANDYYDTAQAKSARGDYEGAISDLSSGIRRYPRVAELYNARGVAYANQRKLKEAYDDFSATIQIDPRNFEAYSNRSSILADGRHYELAVADADAAIEINPTSSMAYSNRARAKSGLGQNEEAVADCDRAIQLDPQNVNAYNTRGAANHMLGRYADAAADYTRTIEANPAHAMAYNNRGVAKQELGDYRGAIADFNKAIELNPNYSNAYFSRAFSHYMLQDWKASLADFRQNLALAPDDVLAPSSHHFVWMLRHRLIPVDQVQAERDKEREAATAELKKYFAASKAGATPQAGAPRDWPSQIADFLTGALTEQAFLAAAKTDDEKTTQTQLAEAHYFAGIKRLVENDRDGAKKQWEQAVALKVPSFESRAATMELENL